MKTNKKAIILVSQFPGNLEDQKRSALVATKEIKDAIEVTTSHCTLRYVDRLGVQSDLDYWDGVEKQIKNMG